MNKITSTEWAEKVAVFNVVPAQDSVQYLRMASAEEFGELIGIFAKALRKGTIDTDPIDAAHVIEEIGDVLWSRMQLWKIESLRPIELYDFGHSTWLEGEMYMQKWRTFQSQRSVADFLMNATVTGITIPSLLSIANHFNATPADVLSANVSKLQARLDSGTLDALRRPE